MHHRGDGQRMPEPTLGERFQYVASRWRYLLTVIGCAAALAFVISELMPRRYTARATVIIDTPAASDPRASAALNPTYLASLSTFERFFTSDTLFQQAAEKFHLDPGNNDIESLRRKVLKVSMQRDTRILEVSATLPDPVVARSLVQFITEQSIAASHAEAMGADHEALENMNAELDHARARFAKAQAEWQRATREDTPDSIQDSLEAAIGVQSEIRRHAGEADADAAEWQARSQEGARSDREFAQAQARAEAARKNLYAAKASEIAAEIAADRKLLASRSGSLSLASAELDSARKELENLQSHVRDLNAMAGSRGERMRIIDPGVAPRRPSSPNVLFSTIAAALLAACLGAAWLALRADEPRPRPAVVRNAQRLA